jgi:uncharacterized protein YecE (DUF72 family)
MVTIGTAAWSIPKSTAERFPEQGSSLRRYASVFDGVEVNSSFYRRHKPETWQRWADSVPDRFRFAVKMPKRITHELRLIAAEAEVDLFLADIRPLNEKLGPVLIQLPPKLEFEATVADAFLAHLRSAFDGRVVIEPRHQSWGSAEASALLSARNVTCVMADPRVIDIEPDTGREEFLYFRLHGSPKVYYSSYNDEEIARYRQQLDAAASDSWCIFDNTASGAALPNALKMLDMCRPNENAPGGRARFHCP